MIILSLTQSILSTRSTITGPSTISKISSMTAARLRVEISTVISLHIFLIVSIASMIFCVSQPGITIKSNGHWAMQIPHPVQDSIKTSGGLPFSASFGHAVIQLLHLVIDSHLIGSLTIGAAMYSRIAFIGVLRSALLDTFFVNVIL